MTPVNDEVHPLTIGVPEAELADLRDRLRRTRLPEAETVSTATSSATTSSATGTPDWGQGPPRSYVADLVRYWADGYDWRRIEAQLNGSGSSTTEIDGLDVHFLHVRSPRPDALPMVLSHGWPSSVLEPLAVIDELTDPSSPDAPAFHVVAPSLPGFGFSGKPERPGWNVDRTADAWAVLMQRLGYDRYFAVGGDWGGRVTCSLGIRHADRVAGLHTFTPYVDEPAGGPGDLTEAEHHWVADTRRFWTDGSGYSRQQSTRPQALAYGLVDSPVGQLSWILDKFFSWTDHRGDLERAVSRDQILDTVTLYWLTATGGSSARFYWENYPVPPNDVVSVPAAVTIFPADIEKLPRHWVEQRFPNLQYWNEVDRGGHFPMLEVPASFVDEVRRALGPMAL